MPSLEAMSDTASRGRGRQQATIRYAYINVPAKAIFGFSA